MSTSQQRILVNGYGDAGQLALDRTDLPPPARARRAFASTRSA